MQWNEYYDMHVELLKSWYDNLVDDGSILWLNYPETSSVIWSRLLDTYHPFKQIAWIYHTHTGGKPLRKSFRIWLWMSKTDKPYVDDNFLRGEYQNPTDKRVKKLIEAGRKPIAFDWWHYEQVKNVSAEKVDHPCQLPLEMVERLICAACAEGGLVFDPFLGSGTTAVACKKNNRGCIGIDMDEKYIEVARKRVAATLEG